MQTQEEVKFSLRAQLCAEFDISDEENACLPIDKYKHN